MLISGSKLGLALQMKKELKRRNAVEPVRGHLKTDSNLGRQDPCPLMRSRAQYSASSISISKPSLCRLQQMPVGLFEDCDRLLRLNDCSVWLQANGGITQAAS